MARQKRIALSNRVVDGLSADGKDVIYWDRDQGGFGVRVYPNGTKAYMVQARNRKGTRRVTLGRHGMISADEARRQGAALLTRIREGEDVGRSGDKSGGTTVAELAERYLREHVEVRCKPLTVNGYRRIIEGHILPMLGKMPITAIERQHVAELHYRLRKTPVAANDAVGTLSRMLNRAEAWGLVPGGNNPCRFVTLYRTRRPERFLTEVEFNRLGEALDEVEAEERIPVHASKAIRLLMLTGCRCGEILGLRWEDLALDRKEAQLRDSKTGPRVVPLSSAAVRVFESIPREADNPWVIVGREPGTRLTHLAYYWYPVRKRAGLDDVRLHDLRHSFASRALALGEDLTMIGKLLGHRKIQTTARYAHLARDSVHEASALVASSIAADVMPWEWPSGSGDDAG
ncbi:MAG: site-specific integrase [Rhodospirillales bacterium]|nr:site-specific integrase [Rhodospirillales bacterium]